MELHVFNSFTGRIIQTLPLAQGPITIGRSPDNAIILESPFISPLHAVIYQQQGKVVIDSAASVNPVKIGGKDVPKGKPAIIRAGDEIQLAEYFLYLVEPKTEVSDGPPDPNSPSAKALAFEEALHDRLLSALNLQTVNTSDRRNPEYIARIDRVLIEMIGQTLHTLDAPAGDHFISAYLKRRIAGDIATAAERRNARHAPVGPARDHFDNNFRDPAREAMEQALSKPCMRILRKLSLNLSRLMPGQRLARDKVLDDMHTLDEKFAEALPEAIADLPAGARAHMILYMVGKDLHDILFGLGPLEDLLRMPDIEEILVLNEDQIYVGKEGRIESTGRRFFSRKVVMSIIERIVGEVGRKIDFREPLVDARLPDGSRVNAVIPPVALSGPTLTIRRFPENPFTMEDLVQVGTLTAGVAHFLRACVQGKRNILVAGGTGTGKTTLLNILGSFIGRDERIVTIEDAAELNLPQRHVVTLEARPPGLEGTGAVSIDMLVRNALRMRPDRIIVGECRGAEAVDMLQAMNTGHDGSLTTVHANDASEALQRIETMVLKSGLDLPSRAIREQIASALHVVLHIARSPEGKRQVTRVSEIAALEPTTGEIVLSDIFARTAQGVLAHTGYVPEFAENLFSRGLLKVDDLLHA